MYDIFDYVMVNQFFTDEECESVISNLETGEWIGHTWTQQNLNNNLDIIDKKDFLIQLAKDIITLLTQPPSTTSPSLEAGDPIRNALLELATQLGRIDSLPDPIIQSSP